MNSITARVKALGLILPPPPPPSALYVPWKMSRGQLWISGQVSDDGAGGIKGMVGRDLDLATAQQAAHCSGLRIIAQIAVALDDRIDRIAQIVRVTGYVQAADDFLSIPLVTDGCSQLLVDVFGPECGLHSRVSVGVAKLPRNFAVECDAVVEYRDTV